MEVVRISAPQDAPNALTIGPIFQQFSHLEELHIVRSNIPAIGKHSFWGVPTLRILNLIQNNISHVLDHNFRGLVNLLELHLDDNRIESMTSETFRHLPELKVLTLSRNRIHELVPRLFLMLGKLHELDLSYNPLVELNPEVFKDVQALRTFKCRSCHLSNINTFIYRLLADLVYLDLGDNEFNHISADEFHSLRKLQILKLDGNQLPVILDRTFGNAGTGSDKYNQGQTDLQVINLGRNRLAKVTVLAFANLTTLRDLDLSYNKFDKLETATFQPLSESLRTLNLSGNSVPMSELKHIIQMVPKLRHLSLADMGLDDLPLGLFTYHEHLKFLNLSGNYFSRLSPQMLTPISRLHSLDLSRNRFRGLDEKIITRLEKIPSLRLKGNPWACDACHIPPLLSRAGKLSALRDLTCKSPYALAGRTVASIDRSELERCSGGGSRAGGDENTSAVGIPKSLLPSEAQLGLMAGVGAVVLFVVSGIAVGTCIIYSRHHANHYYTREERRNQEAEAIFENPTAVTDENGTYKIPIDAPKTKKKKVSIATIDEITKDPELHVLTNGT